MNISHDILIVGGGPVGATLALALRGYGLDVMLLEARAAGTASRDPRTLALSDGSRLILQRLGVWHALQAHATPINTIHVSQRGRFGQTRLTAAEEGLPALGYVLPYAALSDALDAALAETAAVRVQFAARAVDLKTSAAQALVGYHQDGVHAVAQAPLVVLADGGRGLSESAGLTRQTRDYGHSAVVAHVESELPHRGTAYERFTERGPMALLPEGERGYALVWTAAPDEAQMLCALDEAAFLARLHRHFGDRVGRFVTVGRRAAFPLTLSTLRPVTAPHLAVIGNAAQTLHPVAGQGFNLGLRDAWDLALTVQETPRAALGGPAMLQRYRARRRLDTGGGIFFTDFLVRAFSNDLPGFGAARGAGLALTELLAPARRFIARRMSYGAHG